MARFQIIINVQYDGDEMDGSSINSERNVERGIGDGMLDDGYNTVDWWNMSIISMPDED